MAILSISLSLPLLWCLFAHTSFWLTKALTWSKWDPHPGARSVALAEASTYTKVWLSSVPGQKAGSVFPPLPVGTVVPTSQQDPTSLWDLPALGPQSSRMASPAPSHPCALVSSADPQGCLVVSSTL